VTLSKIMSTVQDNAHTVSVNSLLSREKYWEYLPSPFTYSDKLFLKLWTALLIGPENNVPCDFQIRNCFGLQMKVSRYLRALLPKHDISLVFKYWELLMATVPFQSFASSSLGGFVERHVQCTQNPVHLTESAAPSGSSQLHSSMNCGSRI